MKLILFEIVTAKRSRNDFPTSSNYCHFIASRGQEEQVPSEQTSNKKPNVKKKQTNKDPVLEVYRRLQTK